MNKIKNIPLVALFTSLIVVGTFIKIPVPVVPFTLQFLFTTLAGQLIGKYLGSLSVAVYIILGLIGFPVFASGGGIGYILTPSFGYLIGFLLGSFVTGHITNMKKSPKLSWLIFANFTGLMVVYIIGMVYYYFISNFYLDSPIGVYSLILYCFILAVPGDLVLCFFAGTLSKRLLPIIKKG